METKIVLATFCHVFLSFMQNVNLLDLERNSQITFPRRISVVPEVSNEKLQQKNFYRCSPLHQINMIARCPPEYPEKGVIRKCEKGLLRLDEEDMAIIIPETNPKSQVHYANQYCSMCHNDSSAELWELEISWAASANLRNMTGEKILSTLYFDHTLKQYAINVTGEVIPCTFKAVKPQNFNSTGCSSHIIDECPSSFEGPKDCKQFRGSIVCTPSEDIYLNEQCAKCNNINGNLSEMCYKLEERKINPATTLFRLRKSPESNACSIPAVSKFYC